MRWPNKKTVWVLLVIVIIGIIFFSYNYYRDIKLRKSYIISENYMIKVASTSFPTNGTIPKEYTCDGQNINPKLMIENVPINASSLVLIVDDPDSPSGIFTHWLVWNIDPKIKEIKVNNIPKDAQTGENDFGRVGYGGPCPNQGTHRYFFRVYALDTVLNLPPGAKRSELTSSIAGHIIDKGELMGKYSR